MGRQEDGEGRRSTTAVKRGNELIERFDKAEQGRADAARQPSYSEPALGARGRATADLMAMEKRVRLPVALAALRADRAADRRSRSSSSSGRRPGAVPVAAGRRTRSAPARSSSGSTISASCSTTTHYLASFKVTAIFSVLVAVLGLSISLVLAVFADRVIRGADVYKTLLIWPYAVAPAIAGVLWLFLFNPTLGIVAHWLQRRRHRVESAARRQRRADPDRDRRGVEAGQLQLPVLPRRPAVDSEVADRGGGHRRRRARSSASDDRVPAAVADDVLPARRQHRLRVLRHVRASSTRRPAAARARPRRSSSTRSTTTASRDSTSAARRRSRSS